MHDSSVGRPDEDEGWDDEECLEDYDEPLVSWPLPFPRPVASDGEPLVWMTDDEFLDDSFSSDNNSDYQRRLRLRDAHHQVGEAPLEHNLVQPTLLHEGDEAPPSIFGGQFEDSPDDQVFDAIDAQLQDMSRSPGHRAAPAA